MTEHEAGPTPPDFNRRDFIRSTATFGSLMALMGGIPLLAEDATNALPAETNYSPEEPPVSCAIIGCGQWGREILNTLATLVNKKGEALAPVLAVCDNYASILRRIKKDLPPAVATFDDYHKVLELKDVAVVIVATPSHLHKEIVIAALQAGKHVYCEAPLASNIEDARAIAQAAKAAVKLNFQAGLQMRADPAKLYIYNKFIRAGATGSPVYGRAQWHQRASWRQPGSTPEREKALNWRLDSTTSSGLAGELGVHQIDLMTWFLGHRPAVINGWGAMLAWDDGRDVADTVQALLEYPGHVNFTWDATLASTFEADYNMYYGSYATVMMRESKAWLFKETDSPLLGWELYAARQKFGKDDGISLSADATHSTKSTKPGEESPYENSALHHSLKAFLHNSRVVTTGVADFAANFDITDTDALRESLNTPIMLKTYAKAAGYKDGFEATVIAIKTNEAIAKNSKIKVDDAWFEI